MPYEIRKHGDQFCIYKPGSAEPMSCHPSEDAAMKQMAALHAAEPGMNAKESTDQMREASRITLLEAVGKTGAEWDVMLIQAGTSRNHVRYPAAVLKAAAPLYEGTAAYADHDTEDERKARPERSIRDKVGTFRTVRYESRSIGGKTVDGLVARFKVMAPWLREALLEAYGSSEPDFYGLSHNVSADWAWADEGGVRVKDVKKILEVHSVDVVTDPAAGGRVERLVASNRDEKGGIMELTQEQLDELLAKAGETGAQRAIDAQAKIAEEAVAAAALVATAAAEAEAVVAAAAVAVADPPPAGETPEVTEAKRLNAEARQLHDELRKDRTRQQIDAALAEAKISAPGKAQVRARLVEMAERRAVEDSDIKAVLGEIQNYEASFFQEASNPKGVGATFLRQTADLQSNISLAVAGWFEGQDVGGVKRLRTLKEGYCRLTGISEWDWDAEDMAESFGCAYRSGKSHARLAESLTTASWGEIFADNLYVKLMKEYSASPYNGWTKFVSDFDDPPDFQTRHWARIGGYANLSTVAEGATYPVVTSPTDEEITFSIAKRGFLDDVTFEMMVGDRFNKVRRLPAEMALAAARTLYRFVLDMITTDNANMDYDSVALYHSDHANTGTTALSVAGVDAATIGMRSQTRYATSAEILGPRNAPRFLIVPNELEGRAKRIVNPSDAYIYGIATPADTETVMDPHRFKDAGMEVEVYDHLTDATDWWAVADPQKVSTIVMGFLNGNREPELFVQDQPNVGSVFTADKISYKVRHIYGGDVQDHRSFYRMVVS